MRRTTATNDDGAGWGDHAVTRPGRGRRHGWTDGWMVRLDGGQTQRPGRARCRASDGAMERSAVACVWEATRRAGGWLLPASMVGFECWLIVDAGLDDRGPGVPCRYVCASDACGRPHPRRAAVPCPQMPADARRRMGRGDAARRYAAAGVRGGAFPVDVQAGCSTACPFHLSVHSSLCPAAAPAAGLHVTARGNTRGVIRRRAVCIASGKERQRRATKRQD